MMWALKVTRSTMAATNRGSGNTEPRSTEVPTPFTRLEPLIITRPVRMRLWIVEPNDNSRHQLLPRQQLGRSALPQPAATRDHRPRTPHARPLPPRPREAVSAIRRGYRLDPVVDTPRPTRARTCG